MSGPPRPSETRRFSDSELQDFYLEFKEHKELFNTHRMEQAELYADLLNAIRENTSAVSKLATKTESIIEVWEASQGAVQVLKWAGSIILWFSSIGAAVAAVYYFVRGK